MALGWGLWEGPARFIFGPGFPQQINSRQSRIGARLPLTFKGSGIIYGTYDKPLSFFGFAEWRSKRPSGALRHSRCFCSCTLWLFFAF